MNATCVNNTIITIPAFYDMGSFLTTIHSICVVLGIPLNLGIGSVILLFNRLHKPRNIVWIAIVFSNTLLLLSVALEMSVFYFEDSTTICLTVVALYGLPYPLVLLHLFLAMVERYVALRYFYWHKRVVTIRLVIAVQFISSTLLIVYVKSPYFIGSNRIPLECGIHHLQLSTMTIALTVLAFLCVASPLCIYFQLKKAVLVLPNQNVYKNGCWITRLELDATRNLTNSVQKASKNE